jgi:selenide,water dikinase
VRELVLVGGGHAHVQVLRRFMMRPAPEVRITVILDRPEAVYSGMVPGFVARDYRAHELEIDVVPLARRARARVVLARALRVDPGACRVEVEGRTALRWDLCSLDVGSTVAGLDLPGVREHALATRPIRAFVDAVDARLRELEDRGPGVRQVIVVGAGAAGTELAFTLEARLRAARTEAALTLLGDDESVLPGAASRLARAAARGADRRGIRLRTRSRVAGVEKGAVLLEGGERLAADLVVWATGAAPVSLLSDSPLPKDAAGFVRVDDTLLVEGQETLFAVGDCASLAGHPWVPKAGVYAVRQGPVLERNLRAHLAARKLARYRPQRDFLSLLNLGEGRALGAKWGMVASGRPVWRLKDRIDRRFVERFQVLGADGTPSARFPSPESMGMEEMPCGGCAAKLDQSVLARALERVGAPREDPSVLLGLATPDDSAAFLTAGGDVVLATVDAFRAFVDDPWLVGRVAAVNAVSDVLAKGATPRHALALVTVPEEDPTETEETLVQVLGGIRAALDPLGVSLVGGHTTSGAELFVGLSVTGELEGGHPPITLAGLRPGDCLLLTKPLGTGVLLAADMQGRARGRWVHSGVESMVRSNLEAARVARAAPARAATDVSGFGLAGHLGELLRASGVAAELWGVQLPALPGALALLAVGIRSTYHEQNARLRRRLSIARELGSEPALELLFDPQTSGGLLLGVAADRCEATLASLRAGGDRAAAWIGRVEARRPDGRLFSVARTRG